MERTILRMKGLQPHHIKACLVIMPGLVVLVLGRGRLEEVRYANAFELMGSQVVAGVPELEEQVIVDQTCLTRRKTRSRSWWGCTAARFSWFRVSAQKDWRASQGAAERNHMLGFTVRFLDNIDRHDTGAYTRVHSRPKRKKYL